MYKNTFIHQAVNAHLSIALIISVGIAACFMMYQASEAIGSDTNAEHLLLTRYDSEFE